MTQQDLTQTLAESFSALADEVQSLIDRKTILEHKLRFAHEQYQYLADKYAPTAPEISETLAQLQLPPELHHPVLINANTIPLPRRGQSDNSQHQIALYIREGRRAAQQLITLADASKDSSSKETSSHETLTSITTMMEQDFTVEGKKGNLQCPFSVAKEQDESGTHGGHSHGADPTPHKSGDPICAAMFEEVTSQPAPGAASKCPIRYMDKHSPEEIATYVEKHKHQIPRSHEVCIQRYQKNEAQIRKLDAKYGSIVNMIQDLSQLHKPLLPEGQEEPKDQGDGRRASLERVENWAQEVSTDPPEDPETPPVDHTKEEDDADSPRESHFDRPLKEVRVGESPSRPWGISVPVYDTPVLPSQTEATPTSPSPVPVQMPCPGAAETPKTPAGRPSKCPFDHTKFARGMGMAPSPLPKVEEDKPSTKPEPTTTGLERPFAPADQGHQPTRGPQPTFLGPDAIKPDNANTPQMVFNGPVFIGYPMEQAIEFMKHFQKSQ